MSIYQTSGGRVKAKIVRGRSQSTKEETMKRFSEMQSNENHRSPAYHPGDITPDTPVPDYDDRSNNSPSPRQFKFVRQFSKVLSSIITIDEMYPDVPEPEPDYNDDEDSFDSGNPNGNQTNSTTHVTKDTHTSVSDSGDISNVRKISLSNSVNEAVIFRERKASNPELEKRLSDPGNDDLLIRPKKLVNPCIESRERMALHKELLHNYKVGKNILEKPELQKVLEKRKEKQRVDEWESQKKTSTKRTSLEMKLEQQRQKEHQGDMKPIEEKEEKSQSELSKMQAKILSKNSTNAVK
ncbi:hypothetical protein FSP39_004158 [Pinctada imbricata]|uniref:Uncharacterized protein n=1 Tax=Pinctada imbricata TaxID=66713 RepID=A0AA88YHI1_PINIB|nr:hypothetical protein FSP39_004158 [Pinctada imbricata]